MTYYGAIFYDIENVGGASPTDTVSMLRKTDTVGQAKVQGANAHSEHHPDRVIREILAPGMDPIKIGTYQKDTADIILMLTDHSMANTLKPVFFRRPVQFPTCGANTCPH